MSIWDIMRISTSSLRANQTAIEVTSHNVANMNTDGYARQSASLEPDVPRQQGNIYLGSGVLVANIQRAEDRYIYYNLIVASSSLGAQDTKTSGLDYLQEIFNEQSSEGISSALDDFWNSWSDLAASPEGRPERSALVGTTEIMITEFHNANSRLRDLQNNSNNEIKYIVEDINLITEQIADLNVRVQQMEAAGQSAGDYRTERNVLMQELATKINYTYFEDANGMVTINLAGGLPLVEQTTVSTIDLQANPANNGYYDVVLVSKQGNEFNITNDISGGEIYGHLQVRDNYTEDMLDRLDELAYALIDEVNAIHVTGYGLNGATGNNFFSPLASADDASALISLDAAITGDLNNIAAALTNNTGDNQIANQLAALRDASTMGGGTSTFATFYSSMVADIGVETQNAMREYTHTESVIAQMENMRESQTGVVLEEEMANLIRFQQAYQAAARVINTASDMIEVLSNLR